jgi:ribulose-phosphate 3-epimerase
MDPDSSLGSFRLFGSITSADPLRLGDEVARLTDAGVDGIHIDIADGVFTPEFTFGLRVLRAVTAATSVLVDVHLMCVRPEAHLSQLAGIRDARMRVAVHIEACPYPWRTISLARQLGLRVGLAVNPATPPGSLGALASAVDFVNLLTTEPDFSGEHLLPGSAQRVAAARALMPRPACLQVDGGITLEVARDLVAAGADEIVVGRALFAASDTRQAVDAFREAAASASPSWQKASDGRDR